jgi:hypothetical protein
MFRVDHCSSWAEVNYCFLGRSLSDGTCEMAWASVTDNGEFPGMQEMALKTRPYKGGTATRMEHKVRVDGGWQSGTGGRVPA